MTVILVHGFVPKSMPKSVIIPIIKNKNKRISDNDNYIHICLANIFTKVVKKKYCVGVWMGIYILRLINLGSSENMGQECVFLF